MLGLGVASLSAVPTALRTARAGASFLDGLLVGTAVLLPLVTLALILSRAAGRGFRGIVGAGGERLAVLRVALWIGVAFPVLAALAALLKATTHHRGLAGATFGVLGLAGVAAAALVTQRLVALGDRLAARGVRPWLLAVAGTAIGVVPLVAAFAPLAAHAASTTGDPGAAVRAAIVDGAIALVATALVSSVDLGAAVGRVAGIAGVPLAALVLMTATARIESFPPLGQAVRAGGGLAATLFSALEQWTDRDGDGMGSHFGGLDCDEGDPTRYHGAPETPGDGIDQDCSDVAHEGAAPLPARAVAGSPAGAQTTAAAAAPPAAASGAAPAAPAGATTAAHVRAASTPAARDEGGAVVPAVLTKTIAPAGTTPASPAPAAAPARPDVLLVTLDTVRADHTSAYGYGRDTSPRLAELAARGVLFERAYAVSSETQRAISPLVTGRRLNRAARDRREWPTLLPENDTLAERMKRAGYLTAAVSSFTWISQERGFDQGFDRFETVYGDAHPEREATGHLAVEKAIALLEGVAQRTQPIFLWLHLFDAHERYLAHPGIRFGAGRTAAYDGEIAYVDRQLGALLDAVARGPRAGRTAIIVHGSQGEGLGEHGPVGHGVELYEEAIRVPLVIALPGAAPGRYPHPVSTVDIAPTVLDVGGAEATAVEGASLAAIATGAERAPRGPVFARTARRAAVIDGQLKLLVIERKRKRQDRVLLFDLGSDPRETRDLSGERRFEADLGRLREKLSAFESPSQ
ncbi:cell wall surface anchor family protein [Sorangium cellulosum So ce56]|uniref:Cell wall surface anchor family protein n=1 Tax=Sorangium cellulosum (strain So ce56) TaxID=448385 RepID=A9F0A8_SORC5|nr:cell wall surface anchor family protein [Sorangium cellulosum So ce56]